jgi:hypothetical protein
MQALERPGATENGWTEAHRRAADAATRRTARADSRPADLVAARARHVAAQPAARVPRDPAMRLQGRAPLALVLALALVGGVLADAAGPGQRIDLLSPPWLALLGWNLAVYAFLVARAVMPSTGIDPLRRLDGLRLATLLHAGAAALALGLCIGLYARGLVLDYRAGWQSTFLEPAQVHALLSAVLAPATLATGIAMPAADVVAALRVPAGGAAQGAAAAWIHLFAATLALVVVVPRVLLAFACGWRARALSAAVPLDLESPYFRDLIRRVRGDATPIGRVCVLPHALPAPDAARLASAIGAGQTPVIAAAIAFGDEASATLPACDGALQLLVSLAATPEVEHHGVLLERLRAASPTVLVDESGYAARFQHDPSRIEERRAAWRSFAAGHGAGVRFIELGGA